MQIAISQRIKNEIKDYFYITLGLLLYTFGWTIFLLPYQVVTGGVTGIAAVIYYGTGIPIYLSYFLINAALLLAALKILGFKFMVKTIYAIIMLAKQPMHQPQSSQYQKNIANSNRSTTH